jgi:hypothetical protein
MLKKSPDAPTMYIMKVFEMLELIALFFVVPDRGTEGPRRVQPGGYQHSLFADHQH